MRELTSRRSCVACVFRASESASRGQPPGLPRWRERQDLRGLAPTGEYVLTLLGTTPQLGSVALYLRRLESRLRRGFPAAMRSARPSRISVLSGSRDRSIRSARQARDRDSPDHLRRGVFDRGDDRRRQPCGAFTACSVGPPGLGATRPARWVRWQRGSRGSLPCRHKRALGREDSA